LDVVFVIVALRVFVAPVSVFGGWIDALGNAFAGKSTGNAADYGPRCRADRAADRAGCCASGRAACCGAKSSANGMSARFTADGIAIGVAMIVCILSCHD
jgi:hypothetical protein